LHQINEHAPSGNANMLAHKRKYGETQVDQLASTSTNFHVAFEADKALPPSSPHEHHHISADTRHKIDLLRWLGENKDNCALEV